jgi:DNA-binding IclR family transcriptional regulator
MIEVLRKATVVLSELARHGDLTAAELSTLTEEPKTSIYRMLNSMQTLGLVARTPNGSPSFRLGSMVLELASGVLRHYDVREVAAPILSELHDETEHTIFLMVRHDDRAVCIEKLDGKSVRTMEVSVGGSMPLYVGAAPRCLLAFEDTRSWDAYVEAHEIVQRSPSAPSGAEDLLEQLRAVREAGFAIADGETALGMAGIGAPVFDGDGAIQAAISISGPSSALLGDHRDGLIDEIVSSAKTISQALDTSSLGTVRWP